MMIFKSLSVLFLLQFNYNIAKGDDDCGSNYYCTGTNYCCGVGVIGIPLCCSKSTPSPSTSTSSRSVGLIVGIILLVISLGCAICKLRKKSCQADVGGASTAAVNLGAGANEQGFQMAAPGTHSYPTGSVKLSALPNAQLP